MGYSGRQAYYRALNKSEKDAAVSAIILALVKEVRLDLPESGSKKVYLDIKPLLEEQGLKVGRDKVHKCLKDNDLLIKKKKRYVTTTDSHHRFRKYKNEIKSIEITRPEQVFVTDITYVKVGGKHAYLYLMTDAYSKKLMGWNIDFNMRVQEGKKMVDMAVSNRIYAGSLYHHSDRGVQYCSPDYINYISARDMIPSMTEDLHVYENAIAERINGILKQEFGLNKGFVSIEEAKSEMVRIVNIYNSKRRHISLDYRTPNDVHLKPDIKIKSWKKKPVST